MAVYLPFAMQQLFNTPLAMHPSTAEMIVSALSGRMNISMLEGEFTRLDSRGMEDLAAMGRVEFDARSSKKQASKSGPATAQQEGDTFQRVGNIAVLPVQGVLKQKWGIGPYSGATGYDGLQVQLLDALADSSIDAIWLDIASGGGAVDGLFGLTELIWQSNEKNGGKPIWAMAADRAMSAAFAIGTAADKLFVPPTGGVGSVGVITMLADATKALDNEGIAVKVIRYPDQKALSNGMEPIDEFTVNRLGEQVKMVAEMFQETVARNMGLSKKSVAETRGLDYMGSQAKAIGFVNDVLPEAQAWAKLSRKVA